LSSEARPFLVREVNDPMTGFCMHPMAATIELFVSTGLV